MYKKYFLILFLSDVLHAAPEAEAFSIAPQAIEDGAVAGKLQQWKEQIRNIVTPKQYNSKNAKFDIKSAQKSSDINSAKKSSFDIKKAKNSRVVRRTVFSKNKFDEGTELQPIVQNSSGSNLSAALLAADVKATFAKNPENQDAPLPDDVAEKNEDLPKSENEVKKTEKLSQVASPEFQDQALRILKEADSSLFFKSSRLQAALLKVLSDVDLNNAENVTKILSKVRPYLLKLRADQVAKIFTQVVEKQSNINKLAAFEQMAIEMQQILPSTYFVTLVTDKTGENSDSATFTDPLMSKLPASYRFEIFDLSDFIYDLKRSPAENLRRLCKEKNKPYDSSLLTEFTKYVDKRYENPQGNADAKQKIQAHLLADRIKKEFANEALKMRAVQNYILGNNDYVESFISLSQATNYVEYFIEHLDKFDKISQADLKNFVNRMSQRADGDLILSFMEKKLQTQKKVGSQGDALLKGLHNDISDTWNAQLLSWNPADITTVKLRDFVDTVLQNPSGQAYLKQLLAWLDHNKDLDQNKNTANVYQGYMRNLFEAIIEEKLNALKGRSTGIIKISDASEKNDDMQKEFESFIQDPSIIKPSDQQGYKSLIQWFADNVDQLSRQNIDIFLSKFSKNPEVLTAIKSALSKQAQSSSKSGNFLSQFTRFFNDGNRDYSQKIVQLYLNRMSTEHFVKG